jgi:putative endonuclease
MAKTLKQNIGQAGEDMAANYLESNGFTVRERNFRHKRAEIDLIVQKDNLLVFVEVKTRKSDDFGFPETFVSASKAQLIVNAAEAYILQHNWQQLIRFDILAITLQAASPIVHLEDAFY